MGDTATSKRKRGRPSIGDRPMTPAERQRRRTERLKASQSVAAEKSLHLTRLAVATISLLRIMEIFRLYDGESLSPEKIVALRVAATRAGCLAVPRATGADICRLGEPEGADLVKRVRAQLAKRERLFASGKL